MYKMGFQLWTTSRNCYEKNCEYITVELVVDFSQVHPMYHLVHRQHTTPKNLQNNNKNGNKKYVNPWGLSAHDKKL